LEEIRKYSFEKLEVWQLSKELTKEIYRISNTFPRNEQYGIISQIRRASFSITNNLAEGNSRNSIKDKTRFLEIAFGSLMEVLNILIIVNELEFITNESLTDFRKKINEIGNKLNALKISLNK